MNTIQSGWEGFENAVVPKNAPMIQRNEMRKAFYAGALHLLVLTGDIAELNEDAAIAVLQHLHEEAVNFLNTGGE